MEQRREAKRAAFATFVSGCAAMAFAQLVAYPFDVVKKKMQALAPAVPAYMLPSNVQQGATMRDVFAQVLAAEGVSGTIS